MDLSPIGGRFRAETLGGQSMAKSAEKLKCRFASNSMPRGYGRVENRR
jgi:hypothetical protein